jgi:hypothetical protein
MQLLKLANSVSRVSHYHVAYENILSSSISWIVEIRELVVGNTHEKLKARSSSTMVGPRPSQDILMWGMFYKSVSVQL